MGKISFTVKKTKQKVINLFSSIHFVHINDIVCKGLNIHVHIFVYKHK